MLYLLLVKREKKKIKEMARGLFSQVRTCLAGCAAGFLCWLFSRKVLALCLGQPGLYFSYLCWND
jgi:hypothetical protein